MARSVDDMHERASKDAFLARERQEIRRCKRGRRDSLSLFAVYSCTSERESEGKREREKNGEGRERGGAEIFAGEGEEEETKMMRAE